MEQLQSYISELKQEANLKNIFPNHIYQLIATVDLKTEEIKEFTEEVLPQLYTLFENDRIKKDLFFISLLTNNNLDILTLVLKYEQSLIRVNLDDPTSLFDICFHRNRHWLLETLDNHDRDDFILHTTAANKMSTLHMIMVTNNMNVDIQRIVSAIEAPLCTDRFIEGYVDTLKYSLDILRFFKHFEEIIPSELYESILCKNLLHIFSEYVDLSFTQHWNYISEQLTLNEMLNNRYFQHISESGKDHTEFETFTAFTIIMSLLKCLHLCKIIPAMKTSGKDEITGIMETVKEKLLQINSNNFVMEILEDIFCLIFLHQKHFIDNKLIGNNFFCSGSEVRLILSFLKSVFEEIRSKSKMTRTSTNFKQFLRLDKYITDAFWRLEVITELRYMKFLKDDADLNDSYKYFMYYMLASPEGLINLCLKENDLEKANQVIQIFSLKEADIASEISYTIKHEEFKVNLKNHFLLRENLEGSDKKFIVQDIIEKHFKSCNAVISSEDDVTRNIGPDARLASIYNENQRNLDLFDILLTLPQHYDDCKDLLSLFEHNLCTEISSVYSSFLKKVVKIFNHDSFSFREILLTPSIYLDFDLYRNEKSAYEKLIDLYNQFQEQVHTRDTGILNLNHVASKTLALIEEVCSSFRPDDEREQTKLMQKLTNYLKTFSRLLYVERNNSELISKGKEVSMFEILNKNRSKLIGELVYERNLDGADFDHIFLKLKLDLTYHIAACSFPKVNLNYGHIVENSDVVTLYRPRKDIITYIQKRNWLLAFILNKIHKIQDAKIDVNEIRVKTLTNLMKLQDVQNLKIWFDHNEVITVLQQSFSRQIHTYLVDMNNRPSIQNLGTGNSDAIQERLENTKFTQLYQLLLSIPENQVYNLLEFNQIKDHVLCNMVRDKHLPDHYKYVEFISDNKLRIEIIFSEFRNWPGDFCINVIKSELSMFGKIDEDGQNALKNWCSKIELYEQMKFIYQCSSWFEIERNCQNVKMVLQDILNSTDIDVVIKFIDLYISEDELLSDITVNYIESLFDANVSFDKIRLLLYKIPSHRSIELCKSLLYRVRRLEQLNYVVDYLLNNAKEDIVSLSKIQITLKMMTCFSVEDQELHWSLIKEPLNIMEVLLMNTKLDKLGQMIDLIKPDLKKIELDDNELLLEKIDELLRSYAAKSLEFKVITHPRQVRTPDNKIMLSIDSLNLEREIFIMPESVPEKSEWVENSEITECMCCQQITFSMFNRRHHCRRCGRVVCWNCSLKKMQVDTYGDILVRVCTDCFEQTYRPGSSSSGADISGRSISDEYWLLTDDVEHNTIVREEFSYENAPSVSLCLSILKYHSKTEDCPKFLLNQCDNILKLLQPVGSDVTMEIDYNLIIKMLISLAVAAKVISNQCMVQWGTSLADRILSQAELLGLLAERGCLNLIPKSTQSHSPYIDAAILRRIRDKLLEQEQWNLALEVSTKAGLDSRGVFAVWGKSCLKAGNLQLARIKFHRCFDKTACYETSEFSSISELDTSLEASEHHYHSKLSSLNRMRDNKPFKNPPLLNEIIQILESTTSPISQKILKNFEAAKDVYGSTISLTQNPNIQGHHETSICIINKLKNLSAIAAGNYPPSEGNSSNSDTTRTYGPHLERVFYDECIYYLNKYGTHLSLCQFYIKHGEFEEALCNIVDNHVNFDIFIEIYMICLRDAVVDKLHENIVKIDSTFDIWKDYLRCLCIHLEKQSMFNSLYQLQQFMGDLVRAAMTCIRFYSDNASTFENLSNRVEYLHKARDHLKQGLEQEQWVDVSTVRSMSSSLENTFEEKELTNPALVMKMNAKDVDRHINTITRQIDLVRFLAECERLGQSVSKLVPDLTWISDGNTHLNVLSDADALFLADETHTSRNRFELPTLFGSFYEKMQLAILSIVCAENLEDGFKIAHRLIQSYKLKAVKVYCETGRLLAKARRHAAISQLVQCIHNSGEKDVFITEICDEMLALAARTLGDNNATDGQIEDIIKYILDRTIKINSYIETKQLRSAFLVAAKFNRLSDIHRILREAELLNKPDVKRMCQKFLHTRPPVS